LGVATLMAIALIAILAFLPWSGEKPAPVKFSAPFTALKYPALRLLAITALFYNIGFFVLLAYTPFPLFASGVFPADAEELGLGVVFFGWGLAVAVTSVWVAPLLTARLPRSTVLGIVLPLLAVDLVIQGALVASAVALIVCVIVGGLLLGILNTVLTESVMEATDLPRSVASSSYSAVRFLGGAAAPPLAAVLAEVGGAGLPYVIGALSVAIAAGTVILGRRALARIDGAAEAPAVEAQAIGLGDAA